MKQLNEFHFDIWREKMCGSIARPKVRGGSGGGLNGVRTFFPLALLPLLADWQAIYHS